MKTLFLLLAAHAFADYVFQSDFMAKGKNRHTKPFNIPPGQTPQTIWPYVLTSHSLVHGALVYFATGSLSLGIAETVCHWVIDFGKCENWYGIHFDQIAHILCKLAWWGILQ